MICFQGIAGNGRPGRLWCDTAWSIVELSVVFGTLILGIHGDELDTFGEG